MGSSLISERSFELQLAAAEPAEIQPVEVLAADPNNGRAIVISCALMNASRHLVRVAPLPAGTVFPHVVLSYDQGRVARPVYGHAHVLEPSIPYYITVPPGTRMWASFRGTDMGLPALAKGFLVVSVSATVLLEPSADGQSKKIVDGVVKGFNDAIDRLAGLILKK